MILSNFFVYGLVDPRTREIRYENLARVVEIAKERWANPLTREKMCKGISAGKIGVKLSVAHRESLSAAQKKRCDKPGGQQHMLDIHKLAIPHVWSDEEKLQLSLNRKDSKPFKDQYGNTYRSLKDAATCLKIDQSSISRVLNKRRGLYAVKGYEFRYA